ncbi:tRNA uridine-5-carboxymethylaminomethyl(34) synthesis GTPase MnmE [Halorhodospira halochloris]|uniref:tRNA uridine-5-carboxymethylaminomethyl(34) synthesis GTPase MnmE n=1 Tax=Halorhodospira halochloris TaxID=1052 RepID=UPI002379150A|nr:tRNA uridine-5-carboxymethylaminomethyl(34) synthesis GTPase MnmE [Halorhodospira halochloris]
MVHNAPVSRTGGSEIDTIAAVATAPGKGAVAIIRISGPIACDVAESIAGNIPSHRIAALRTFRNSSGEAIDTGLVIPFLQPNSYTGEDVVELQCHGGPAVVTALFSEVCSAGARPAERGEFTERAFLNGQLDLSQAEAIAALIDAESQAARKAALRSLDGSYGNLIRDIADRILELRSRIEATLDFPDEEDITDFNKPHLINELCEINSEINGLLQRAENGLKLRSGYQISLVGRPNVGKSKLMNVLVGRESSIVTDTEGTTRDLIRERFECNTQTVDLVDTAGIRFSESINSIELEGIRRAQQQIEESDIALLVIELHKGLGEDDIEVLRLIPEGKSLIVACNKADLCDDRASDLAYIADNAGIDEARVIPVSAISGTGLHTLREIIADVVADSDHGDVYASEQRHVDSFSSCKSHLEAAVNAYEREYDIAIVAEHLRNAQNSLSEITGHVTPEHVLDSIFSKFCIGK